MTISAERFTILACTVDRKKFLILLFAMLIVPTVNARLYIAPSGKMTASAAGIRVNGPFRVGMERNSDCSLDGNRPLTENQTIAPNKK